MIPSAVGDIPVVIEVKGTKDACIKLDDETGYTMSVPTKLANG